MNTSHKTNVIYRYFTKYGSTQKVSNIPKEGLILQELSSVDGAATAEAYGSNKLGM
jgi:hypothetical protein